MRFLLLAAVAAPATAQKAATPAAHQWNEKMGEVAVGLLTFFSPVGLGSWSLGALIGGIASYFIVRQHVFTLGAFSAVIGVVGGAGVLQLLSGLEGLHDPGVWWYPCGLLFGAVMMAIWWDPSLNSSELRSDNKISQTADKASDIAPLES